MHASVIVPVQNAAILLPGCLKALRAQTERDFEVLVADDRSTDGSVRVAETFASLNPTLSLRVIRAGRPGPGGARNVAAKEAAGEWLAFTDADCLPAPTWLARLRSGETGPEVAAVAGRIMGAPGNLVARFLGLFTLRGEAEGRLHSRYTLLAGGFPTANLAVRRSAFEAVGGFEEEMRTGEDHDLCRRLYAEGFTVRYHPAAVVLHRHRETVGGMLRQALGIGGGQAHLLRRHRPAVVVELPRLERYGEVAGLRCWLNLASADKKAVALLLLTAAWLPLGGLLPAYYAFLTADIVRRLRKEGKDWTLTEAAIMAGLHVLRSAALTAGRWQGSLRHRVLCV